MESQFLWYDLSSLMGSIKVMILYIIWFLLLSLGWEHFPAALYDLSGSRIYMAHFLHSASYF